MWISQNLKQELPYDLAIPLLSMYPNVVARLVVGPVFFLSLPTDSVWMPPNHLLREETVEFAACVFLWGVRCHYMPHRKGKAGSGMNAVVLRFPLGESGC